MSKGRLAGVAVAFGVTMGLLTHTFLAGLGLSAVIAQSEMLFLGIKYLGVAYLVYLGVQALRAKGNTLKFEMENTGRESYWESFRGGAYLQSIKP